MRKASFLLHTVENKMWGERKFILTKEFPPRCVPMTAHNQAVIVLLFSTIVHGVGCLFNHRLGKKWCAINFICDVY